MKKFLVLMSLLILFYGCAVRSISDTGYSQTNKRNNYISESKEIDELEMLGINKSDKIDETNISKALKKFSEIKIPKSSSVLVIQSGAEFPDSEMLESLSSYWNINQLSGDSRNYKGTDLNKIIRYTAATGGNAHILAYWGIVETAEINTGAKTVSWIPIVGWSLPDEKTNMRIRLKFAVIDVESGSWQTFQPKPVGTDFLSSITNRKGKDQEKIIELKKAVYLKAAEELYKKFGSN